VYKHALERNGVRSAIRTVKRAEHVFDSVWCRKASGRRSWNAASICASSQDTRHDGRRLGSFLHSLSQGREQLSLGGGRWDDPGQAGESVFVLARSCMRRQLSVGLEPIRWCPRTTWDVRGRDDFGEGSSSRRIRPSAGGQHPERREALPRRKLGCGSNGRHGGYSSGLWGQRVHRDRIGQSERKRIAALLLAGSGRANGSGPARAPAPNEGSRWQNARERGTVESVFNLQD